MPLASRRPPPLAVGPVRGQRGPAPPRLCGRPVHAADLPHTAHAFSKSIPMAAKRSAFGQKLHEHGSIGAMLADNEIDLHQARLTIWHTAWCLDQGNKARHESSIAKVAVSEALYRVADRAVQILGGTGVSDDTVVAGIFQDIRAFRIYDGPSEVHRWAIARRIMKPFSEPDNTGND